MRSYLCLSVAVLCAVLPAAGTASAADGPSFTIEDRRITESSGLAASRAHPGVYWTHNDSDDGPYVYAVDGRTGRTVATVTLRGVDPRDVEGISVGPRGDVYVGDIGDNLGGTWPEVWIYRFREPEELKDTTVTPVRHTVRYDGGPRDAESLMVHPKTGRVYIVSKRQEGGGGLYEGPEKLSPSGVNTFRRKAGIGLWATDGAFSPDGSRLVVRGYFEARTYRWQDGRIEKLGEPALPMQRQGESVTFTSDGRALMYGTEGAGSAVTRVTLSGKLLPESVAREDKAREERARQLDEDSGEKGSGGSEDGGDAMTGAATLAGLAVLALAVRRMFRRGRG